MSIFIQTQPIVPHHVWDFRYDNRYDLFYAMRHTTVPFHITLQGSCDLIIDIDQKQEIVSFTATLSAESSFWQQNPALTIPQAWPGQVYVFEDIDDDQEQVYFTNLDYSIFYARLGNPIASHELQHIAIAKQIVLDVSSTGMLAGVWISNLPSEIRKEHGVSGI